jgi:pilus assembly protein CpaB
MKKPLAIFVALGCGVLATVLASQYLNAQNGRHSIEMAEIFVATVDIDVGEEISLEKMKLEQWPADRVPPGSSNAIDSLKGKFAKQRFYAGEAIMPVKLMDENWTEVPRDYRVVAMRASDSGIANLIQPGDRVDVSAFFKKGDFFPQSTTKTVLRGIRVYALDGDTERRVGDERPDNLKNIQLLIHQRDTNAWELAQKLGEVSLQVSSEAASDADSTKSAAKFQEWLDDLQSQQDKDKVASRNSHIYTSPVAVAAPAPAKRKVEGFRMMKHSGGQVIEYWVEPGKLPRRMSEVGDGEESESTNDPTIEADLIGADIAPANSASNQEAVSGSGDAYDVKAKQAAEFSYLNGPQSPLFQNK